MKRVKGFIAGIETKLYVLVIIAALVGAVYGVDYLVTRLSGYNYVPGRWGTVIYDTRDGTMWARGTYDKRQIIGPDGKPVLYEGWGEQ